MSAVIPRVNKNISLKQEIMEINECYKGNFILFKIASHSFEEAFVVLIGPGNE